MAVQAPVRGQSRLTLCSTQTAGLTPSAADEPTERAHMTAETKFEPSNVNVRIKISALWTSMLFVFAYVDLFSLYRPDFRADLEAGEIGGFTVDQSFLLGTTVYVVIPSLMLFCALILRPRVNRIANIVLSIMYALTSVGGAIGEWNYYILGSAIEVALLAAIVYYAWTPWRAWNS
jgi:Family of unknown function (DUF6326)